MTGTKVIRFGRRPFVVETTLRLPSGPLEIWVVHTIAPLPVSFETWKGELSDVARLLRARGTARLLVIGDFNATWGNRGFADVLGTGLQDGAAARGDAFSMTYSEDLGPLPPLARIDHVLTGAGLAVGAIRTEDGPGSDHRSLVATVLVRGR